MNNDAGLLESEVAAKLQAVVLCDAIFGAKTEDDGNGGNSNYDDRRHHRHHNTASYGLKPLCNNANTTNATPQILCPLNNVPFLDYIMEFLTIRNSVEQVILVTNHESPHLLEDYLQQKSQRHQQQQQNDATTFSWNDSSSSSSHLEILLLKDTSLLNAGDALRELYKRNWINSNSKNAKPFVLVQGNVIANVDLKACLSAHQQRAQHDASAMFTCILKPIGGDNGSHESSSSSCIVPPTSDLCVGLVPVSAVDTGVFPTTAAAADGNDANQNHNATNGNTSHFNNSNNNNDYRVFVYDNHASKTNATVPCSFVVQSQSPSANNNNSRSSGGLVLRNDLLDTGIYLCSPDVLGRFEDEFDYLDICQDFISNSVAEEEEGLQTKIYAHVLWAEEAEEGNNYTVDDKEESSLASTNSRHRNRSRLYAARAMDFASYHAISQDLLRRWAYPMVPDSHMLHSLLTTTTPTTTASASTTSKPQPQHYKLAVDHSTARRQFRKSNHNTIENQSPNVVVTTTATTNPPSTKAATTTYVSKYQYKECLHPTKVGRRSVCRGPGMVGSHGSIGEECVILQSVVGNHVTIGDHCSVRNSHIWDSVTVEDHVSIESSVLATGCIVKSGAVIPRGCVIGQGCIIGTNVALQPFTRITLVADEDEDPFGDDNDDGFDSGFGDIAAATTTTSKSSSSNNDDLSGSTDDVTDTAVVGSDGKGHQWLPPVLDDGEEDSDDDDGDDDEGRSQEERLRHDIWIQLQSMGASATQYYQWRQKLQERAALELEQDNDDFSDDENDDDFGGMDGVTESEAFSAYTDGAFTFGDDNGAALAGSSIAAAAGSATVVGRQKGVDVVKEMTEICMEFDESVFPMENLSIELNSYKFSQNASYSDCTTAATLAMLQKMEITPDMKDGKLVATLKSILEHFWGALLQKLSIGLDEEVAILVAVEMAATGSTSSSSMDQKAAAAISEKLQSGMSFRFVLQTMHDQEVLSEEAILKWAAERKASKGGGSSDSARIQLFQSQPVQDFLEWLEEDSEDDDSDDDSD